MKITTNLDQIDLGSMALPEFQRGYVWNRDQVRELMQSLYRRYPVGSLLVWITRTESWYIHSFLSGRFTGSTETALNQDLRVLNDSSMALDRLSDKSVRRGR